MKFVPVSAITYFLLVSSEDVISTAARKIETCEGNEKKNDIL
jgi:hypothetical protein